MHKANIKLKKLQLLIGMFILEMVQVNFFIKIIQYYLFLYIDMIMVYFILSEEIILK